MGLWADPRPNSPHLEIFLKNIWQLPRNMVLYKGSWYAPLAQLVEHLTLNQGVQSSSLWWCTSNWIKTFIFQHFSFYCGQYVGKQKKEDENPLFYFKFLYLYPSFILFPFQKKRLFNHSRLSIYIINLISILFSKLLVIVMKSLYYSLFQLRLNNLELIMSFLQF